MGEVYRARDTRLEREVALKVLPEDLADNEERLRRFEREAITLASLNHPNVAQVFSIDQVGDTCFMAMELVPGEDLAARISRGALPLDETLDVCRQVAEGVETAHEAGVIHRDLKPANVMITPEGKVKVLDFGLAKPAGHGPGANSTADSVLTTEEGRLLGTPTYMAPEQARGRPIDRRVDVWAFGCVLYECLARRRAFNGESLGDVLAAVLQKEPVWSALPASTPRSVRELLVRCLRKDPRLRLRDIGDARIALEEAVEGKIGSTEERGANPRLVGILAAIAVVGIAAAILGWARSPTEGNVSPRSSRMYPITYGAEWEGTPSWSPSAERMAFTRMVNGSLDIHLKPVVGETSDPLVTGPGDEYTPRWSPDGKHIAFLSSGAPGSPLCLVRPGSQAEPRELIDTNVARLAINILARCLGDRPWLDNRNLIVSRALPSAQMAVFRVSVESSEVHQLSAPPVGADDLCASLSFDGETIVFERRVGGTGELWTMDADGAGASPLLADGLDNKSPAWRPDGQHVLYRSYAGESFENVWEFDVATGEKRRVTNLSKNIWDFAVSPDGRLAIQPFWHDTFLWSLDMETRQHVELTTHVGDNFGGRFSPDGEFIAYHSNRLGDTDVWRIDVETGAETNLTSHPGPDCFPDWSPDGSRIVFVSNREGTFDLYVMDADGGNKRRIVRETVLRGTNALNSGLIARWAPDGERIAYLRADEDGTGVWTVRADGRENRLLLENVYHFDWLGDRMAVFSRQESPGEDLVLQVIHLDSGDTRELYRGPHMEIAAAPDATAIAFCSGVGHLGMKPHVLRLIQSTEPGGLPEAVGAPEPLYPARSVLARPHGWLVR